MRKSMTINFFFSMVLFLLIIPHERLHPFDATNVKESQESLFKKHKKIAYEVGTATMWYNMVGEFARRCNMHETSSLGELIARALDDNEVEMAHGYAYLYLQKHQLLTPHAPSFFDEQAVAPEVEEILRKHYFLLTKDASALIYRGRVLTLTLQEVICSKNIAISNGKLDLSSLHLSSLESLNIFPLEAIQHLDVSHNHLSSLPDVWDRLYNLTSLDVSYNQLSTLPCALEHLSLLMRFDCHHNALTHLPDEIGMLKKIWRLDCSYNNLNALPESMKQLDNLHWLTLIGNHFKSIPLWLETLPRLTKVII